MTTPAPVPPPGNVPTPPEYPTFFIRRNVVTGELAVRSGLPTPDGTLEWVVGTLDYGGRYATWGEVNGPNWVDVQGISKGYMGGDGALTASVVKGNPGWLTGDGTLSATITVIPYG